jgi:hypothetical protein
MKTLWAIHGFDVAHHHHPDWLHHHMKAHVGCLVSFSLAQAKLRASKGRQLAAE